MRSRASAVSVEAAGFLRYTHRLMRRGVAILLALVFSWMLALPAFMSAESKVPACCRKNGKHHCMMMAMDTLADSAGSLAVRAKCPAFPKFGTVSHSAVFAVLPGQAVFAGLVSHPAVSAQTAAGFRIFYHRSKQKRGPPASLLS